MYLNIEYLDGKTEAVYFGELGSLIVKDAVVTVYDGNNPRTLRRQETLFPTHNIRKMWTSEDAEAWKERTF